MKKTLLIIFAFIFIIGTIFFTYKISFKEKKDTKLVEKNPVEGNEKVEVKINTPKSSESKKEVTKKVNENINKTKNGYSIVVKNGVTYIDDILIVNKSYSLPENYGSGLEKEVLNAFNLMKSDAQALNLNIYISSGFRAFQSQANIYNKYVLRDGKDAADTYSARPGYSEHQSGLSFDLNSINSSFTDTPEGKWVNDNCYLYGFIIRFPDGKQNETGYKYESWHLRYVGKELAKKIYNNGNWQSLEGYFGIESKYLD